MILYGDIDQDGVITKNDHNLALLALDGQIQLTKEQMLIADVNGDGVFNGADAALIGQFVWFLQGGTNYSELRAYNVYRNFPNTKISDPQIVTYWNKLLENIKNVSETETVSINSISVDLPKDTGINEGLFVENKVVLDDGTILTNSVFESENKKDTDLIDYIDRKDVIESMLTNEYEKPTDEILNNAFEENNISNESVDQIIDHVAPRPEEIYFFEPIDDTISPPIDEDLNSEPEIFIDRIFPTDLINNGLPMNDAEEKRLPIDEETGESGNGVIPIIPIDTPEDGGVVPPNLPTVPTTTNGKDILEQLSETLNVPKELVIVGGLLTLFYLLKD